MRRSAIRTTGSVLGASSWDDYKDAGTGDSVANWAASWASELSEFDVTNANVPVEEILAGGPHRDGSPKNSCAALFSRTGGCHFFCSVKVVL